jgi:hypothetical protein
VWAATAHCRGGDNTEDKNNADAVQGTSLLLNGTDDYIDLSAAISDLADTDKFTISFDFKPNFAYDGSVQYIFYVGSSTSNNVYIRYRSIGDYYQISREIGGTPNSATAITDAFTSNEKLQQWTHFDVAIDLDNDMISVAINGAIVGVWNDSTAAWSATPTALWLGHFQSSAYCAGYFDNVALYDGALLPYGAYFTGNGSVDTDVAHDDILAFVKGDESDSDSLKIGTGTITISGATSTTGPDGAADSAFLINSEAHYVSIAAEDGVSNFDSDKGTISFWYYGLGTIGYYNRFFEFYTGTTNDFWMGRTNVDTEIRFFYDGSYITATIANAIDYNLYDDGIWSFIVLKWDRAADSCIIQINGVDAYNSTMPATTAIGASGTDTFVIGNDNDHNDFCGGRIANFTITNNPDTPQIPTVMGKPVHVPLIEVE